MASTAVFRFIAPDCNHLPSLLSPLWRTHSELLSRVRRPWSRSSDLFENQRLLGVVRAIEEGQITISPAVSPPRTSNGFSRRCGLALSGLVRSTAGNWNQLRFLLLALAGDLTLVRGSFSELLLPALLTLLAGLVLPVSLEWPWGAHVNSSSGPQHLPGPQHLRGPLSSSLVLRCPPEGMEGAYALCGNDFASGR